MITHPTIYKRTNTGAIQIWMQEVDGSRYRTISGQIDGAKTTSEWTVAKAKNVGRSNETTPEQQALFEVRANYEEKLKRGYFKTLAEVDNERSFFSPMLAYGYKDKFKFKTGEIYYSQPKLDGFRAIVTPERLQSRTGKDDFISCPHILEALEPFFEKYPDIMLDGELYNHELKEDFNSISSIVRTKYVSSEDLEKSRQLIQYHVYDYIDANNPKESFYDRWNKHGYNLGDLLQDNSSVKIVPTHAVYTIDNIDEMYSHYLEDGYEGQIIRLNAAYQNKRSNNLLKRKEFIDTEYKILDIVEGDGNRSGIAGRIIIELPDGRDSKASVKGTWEFARKLLEEKDKYIGGQCTVRYVHLTPDGKPRFPVAVAFYDGERNV